MKASGEKHGVPNELVPFTTVVSQLKPESKDLDRHLSSERQQLPTLTVHPATLSVVTEGKIKTSHNYLVSSFKRILEEIFQKEKIKLPSSKE